MKKFDFYGDPFKLHVAGHFTITSSFGGGLSILTTILMLVYVYFNGSDIFFRRDPWTYQENQTLNSSHTYNFTNTDFRFFFNLFYGANKSSFHDPRYINLKFITKWRKDQQLYIKTFPLKRCSKNALESIKDIQSDYILERLVDKNYICPSFDNFTIGGSWVEHTIEFGQIQVYPCNNKTDNIVCKPFEEINDFVWKNRIYFSIYYPLSVVKLNDYKDPIGWNLKEDYFYIGNLLKYRFINYALDKISITTDSGILFPVVSEQEGYSINLISFDERIPTPDDPYFFSIDFYSSFNLIWYNRSYIKLMDIISNFGGMLQIVTIVFSIIVSCFSSLQRTKFMTDKVFVFQDLRDRNAVTGITREMNENDNKKESNQNMFASNPNNKEDKNYKKNKEISCGKNENKRSTKIESCDCGYVCGSEGKGSVKTKIEDVDQNPEESNCRRANGNGRKNRRNKATCVEMINLKLINNSPKGEKISINKKNTSTDGIEIKPVRELKDCLDDSNPKNLEFSRNREKNISSSNNRKSNNQIYYESINLEKNKISKEKNLMKSITYSTISNKTTCLNKKDTNNIHKSTIDEDQIKMTKNYSNHNNTNIENGLFDRPKNCSKSKQKREASVDLKLNDCQIPLDSNTITNRNQNTCSKLKHSERNNLCDKNLKRELPSELNLSKFTDDSRCLFKANSPKKKDQRQKKKNPCYRVEDRKAFVRAIDYIDYGSKEIENKKNIFTKKLISKKKSDKLKLNCLQKFKFLFLSCLNLKKLKNTQDYRLLMLMGLIDKKIENFFDYLNVIKTIEETNILKEIILLDHQKLILSLLRKETLNVYDFRAINDNSRLGVEKEIENEDIVRAVDELFKTCSLEFTKENIKNPIKLNKNFVDILDEKIEI